MITVYRSYLTSIARGMIAITTSVLLLKQRHDGPACGEDYVREVHEEQAWTLLKLQRVQAAIALCCGIGGEFLEILL